MSETIKLRASNAKEVINSLSIAFNNHREITCKMEGDNVAYGKITDICVDYFTTSVNKVRFYYKDVLSVNMY